jgi:hypothetical protein
MIPHITGSVLTREASSVDLLLQLDQREPEVIGQTSVAELPELSDAPLESGPGLVLAPQAG